MSFYVQYDGQEYLFDPTTTYSLAIEQSFTEAQPSFQSSQPAIAKPISGPGFIGSTAEGGSCNVYQINFIPHCHGTHTENCGHIINKMPSLNQTLTHSLLTTLVIDVVINSFAESGEQYFPNPEAVDQVLSAAAIHQGIQALNIKNTKEIQALVIRTLPNTEHKCQQQYNNSQTTPYLTTEAMQYIDQLGIDHLLVDIPSVDRSDDQGQLTNHHLFWHIEPLSRQLQPESKSQRTITEMIFVPHSVTTGLYLLNLQIPAFGLDAAPSRPLLIPLIQKEKG